MSRDPKRRLTPPAKGASEPKIIRSELEEFAHRLHTELLKRGWSQSDFARRVWEGQTRRVGKYDVVVGRDRISAYINAKAKPEPKTLKMMADALGLTPEELAPSITASVVEKEAPSLEIKMLAEHPDKCLVKVNRLLSLDTAMAIGKLISEEEKRK